MAPHSSTFAWKIPWTDKPGGLKSMGSLESDMTEVISSSSSSSVNYKENNFTIKISRKIIYSLA